MFPSSRFSFNLYRQISGSIPPHSSSISSSFRKYSTKGFLSQMDYERLSNESLDKMSEQLEGLGDKINMAGYDCEFSNGVITLRLGHVGTYVINRQPPNKQIWLSSPLSGPKRYDFDLNRRQWTYEREKLSLDELLSKELTEVLEVKVQIKI